MKISSISNPDKSVCPVARPHAGSWRRVVGCVALVTFLLPATVASAVEYTAARKAGRGLAGMTCGFLEIPGNIVKETRESGPVQGFTLGLAMGLGNVVVRTLVGVYEFVSSPFDVPEGFKPIIEPEFPWDYFAEPKP